ncbi:MAG: PAS domain-containing protein [Bdellovibrionales bacterium]|nr:PAS domain-containing protein [Ramlibacter sp.]
MFRSWRHSEPQRPYHFPAAPGHAAARRQIIWLTALLVIASGLGLVATLIWLRGEASNSADKLTESLSRVIEEQTSRTFQATDQRLQLAASRLNTLNAASDLNVESAHAMLREQIQGLPFIRAMWVLDAEGRITFDSDVGHLQVSLKDREYFQVYRQNPQTEFHISMPVRSRSTGEWLLGTSRPIRDASGKVTGVIVAAVEPRYFDKLWREIDLGIDGAVAVFRRDGVLMMRTPAEDAAMGRSYASSSLFTDYLPRAASGTRVVQSAFDSKVRTVSYRTMSAYPGFVITVGRGQAEVMAAWTRLALFSSLVWLAAAIAVLLMSAMLHRQLVQRQRTEVHFRRLAQAMPQIVFITNAAGRLIFVNDQWQALTGTPVQEVLTKGWLHWVHPDDRERARNELKETLASGENVPSEHRLLTHDGSYRWHLARATANRDASGRLASWYGTSTDIDDLKQAEAAIKAQNELVSMAGRLSRLGGWALVLPEMRFIWSEEASDILGLPPGSAPTLESAITLCAPESRELATQATHACVTEGRPFDIQVRMQTPAGIDVWVRSMGQAVRNGKGEIVRMQGAFQDVTARVQAEREMRASLQTLKRASEATQVIMQQRSLESLIEEVARHSREVLGAQRALVHLRQAQGRPQSLMAISQADEQARSALPQDAAELELPLMGREGGTIGLLQITGKPEGGFTAHDEFVGAELAQLASIAIDNLNLLAQVTELNTGLEEKIARRTNELSMSNAELEAFSYSVSHDLRSPLGTIDGFTRLLLRDLDGERSARVSHYLSRIQAGVSQMGHLIDGLLSLAHVSRVALRSARVDISAMALEIMERLQASQPDRLVAWSVEPDLVAQGDDRLLRSVLENLLGNAWKFSARREAAEISLGFSAREAAFFVRDNGAGFDMAYADKLFGAFQRLHEVGQFPGTGIGLATVARIVARHRGRIWVVSAPEAGATFYFTLPVD